MTATYMGGRRGPPDGDERPLRGLPGGRARPRPGATPPDDDGQPAAGDGDLPGPPPPDPPGQSGPDGVVRPLRPLRVVPGAAERPPLRVLPGGADAPSELPDQEGQPPGGDGLAGYPPGPRPEPRRRAAPRRRWLAAVLAVTLLAGLAVTGRVVGERPSSTTGSTAPATTATPSSTPPAKPTPVVATIATGGFPSDMAAGAGALWVAGSDEVLRVDPATDSVAARIPVGATGSGPAGVAVGGAAVWVPVAVPGTLWGIDPRSNKVTARIPLGGPLRGPISVAATRDAVWVACCDQPGSGVQAAGGRLLRIDPRRKRVVADIALSASPVAVAADASAAWVATAGGRVLVVSQKRNRVVAGIGAGGPLGFSQTIAVGAGGVWVADPFDEQVVRIDPKSRRVTARIPAGAATTLAVSGDGVWALSSLGLVRVDPARARVAAIASDPDLRRARLVAAGPGTVWTAAWSSVTRIDPDLVTP